MLLAMTKKILFVALGYCLDDRGSRVRFPAGAGIFLFTTASRTALGPTQPPVQWLPGALSLGVKRPGREANYSRLVPRSKNEWGNTSTPQYAFMAWCSVKAQGQLYLYLHLFSIIILFISQNFPSDADIYFMVRDVLHPLISTNLALVFRDTEVQFCSYSQWNLWK
jgi:hypothetical protein